MEIDSFGQFINRIVNHCVNHGFYYYVFWELPEGRNLTKIDQKITDRYNAHQPRWERFNDRKKGKAVVRYFRFNRYALLVATEGDRDHLFFHRERYRDIRINPLVIWNYSIGVKGNKAEVRLRKSKLLSVKEVFQKIALEPQAKVQSYYNGISPFTYRGILKQKHKLIEAVNQRRKRSGLPIINPYAKPAWGKR